MFTVDEHASFVVDGFVDAKESSGVGKATAVPEVDGSIFSEHKGVYLIYIDTSGLVFLLNGKVGP